MELVGLCKGFLFMSLNSVRIFLSLFAFMLAHNSVALAQAGSQCIQSLNQTISFPNDQADNQMEYDYLQRDPNLIYKLNYEPTKEGPLSMAQKVAIAWYTISYTREETIIVNGAKKLPPMSGTFYRGEPARYSEKDLGKNVTIKKFRSVSMNRSVAEGFMNTEKPSQLLMIKAKSARDISPYSQGTSDHGVAEEEALILPGVQLRIDKIYPGETHFDDEETGETMTIQFQIVEMTEL